MQDQAPLYYPTILKRLLAEPRRDVEKPEGKNVHSPHPDDDAFACGGTIRHGTGGGTITSALSRFA